MKIIDKKEDTSPDRSFQNPTQGSIISSIAMAALFPPTSIRPKVKGCPAYRSIKTGIWS